MEPDLFNYLQTFLTDRRKELFKEILNNRTKHFTVVTEDVYQLHNTSAVMRSCDIFGIQDVYVVEEIGRKRIDKEIAMGAQKWVTLNRYDSSKNCIKSLRAKGYQIIATTPNNDSTLLQDFDISRKSALFFGTESEGLSDDVLEEADGSLKIPMYGFTESLNISVSAAIILQHLISKLRASEIDWRLSEIQKKEVEIEWTKKSIKNVTAIMNRYIENKMS